MYSCPNCGGALKFDIASQQLLCEYCHTSLDPHSYQKDKDVEESNTYDTVVYTCPQCGGEIIGTDNTAATFCSFCGGSAILDSHISKDLRPKYILPFKKSKEDCKKAYHRKMKLAIFAPKELKDSKYIDNFRGIYMPYWLYHLKQDGPVSLHSAKSYRKGDYRYTDHYQLDCQIDASYPGFSYDASSSFADDISEGIAPFKVNELKDFTPSYLCGFYADTSDVDASVYEDKAYSIANEASLDEIRNHKTFRKYPISSIGTNRHKSGVLQTQTESTQRVMFPVWFLSYRCGNRVAYATVNGQTGKVASDLPIDIAKYLIGSILLAIPTYLLLNSFFTFRPTVTLMIAAFLAVLTSILYLVEINQIIKKDNLEHDRGLLSRKKNKDDKNSTKGKGISNSPLKNLLSFKNISFIILMIIVYKGFLNFRYSLNSNSFVIILFIATLITTAIGIFQQKKTPVSTKLPHNIGSFVAVVISLLIFLINPVSDIFYYLGAMLSMAAILFTILGLIKNYNILSTRQLPQFIRQGGDDRA